MAFRTKKISQMDPKGASLASTDLLEISELVSGSYVTKSITGAEIIASAPAASWGTITGTLSTQTDLQNALDAKVPTSRTLTINGTTQDLSANRTFTVATGITIGTTAITSGTNGRFLFDDAGVVSETNGAFWDKVNGRFGLGTSTPAGKFTIFGGGGIYTTTSASVNSDITMYDENLSSYFQLTKRRSTATGSFGLPVGSSEIFCNTAFGINSNNYLAFAILSSERMRLAPTTGNVLINTTTDAGFKLDVNGTARVSGEFTVTTNIISNQVRTLIIWGEYLNTTNNAFTVFRTTTANGNIRIYNSASIGTTVDPVASAQLEVVSTTKGFLPPRMTTTQKNAIATPATGLMVYDTTLNLISVYNGTTWITL